MGNIASAESEYTDGEMWDINDRLSKIALSGERYPAGLQVRIGVKSKTE